MNNQQQNTMLLHIAIGSRSHFIIGHWAKEVTQKRWKETRKMSIYSIYSFQISLGEIMPVGRNYPLKYASITPVNKSKVEIFNHNCLTIRIRELRFISYSSSSFVLVEQRRELFAFSEILCFTMQCFVFILIRQQFSAILINSRIKNLKIKNKQ